MEGFHVKVSEAICLGASLAASVLLYYHYKKSKRIFDKLDVGLESVQKTVYTKTHISLFSVMFYI